MSKFVPDIKTTRWVVISSQRNDRPDDFSEDDKPKGCPFCYGNEHLTPSEVYRVGGEGGENKTGWIVRVIPNKYPITDIHEVIIHSPNCDTELEELPTEHVEQILRAYRQRYQTHAADGQVMIFCNSGEHAGASLKHPHAQLVVIPRQINLDALEKEPFNNMISENEHFSIYCPDFSQWPYEVWITPKTEGKTYGETTDEELHALAPALKNILSALSTIFDSLKPHDHSAVHSKAKDFAYNYYLYHKENWYLRIIPRLVHRAGFELGTGLSVNIVDPDNAAQEIKKLLK